MTAASQDEPSESASSSCTSSLSSSQAADPSSARRLACRRDHLVAKAYERGDAVLVGDRADVRVDLVLQRVAAAPVRIGLIGERVERGRHVAAGPRIGVVAPHPAEIVGTLPQPQVGVPRALELDRHRQRTESGTDDSDRGHG